MPRKETGTELRNLKRVFVFNKAVSTMHKKKPWTQAYQNKIIFMLYSVYLINKAYGFAKQRQVVDLLHKFGRTGMLTDFRVLDNTGLVKKEDMGVYSYRITPKGLELLKEIEWHIKYTRIDKFI